jgi:cyanophycinase
VPVSGVLALCGDRPFEPTCTHEPELLEASGTTDVLVLPTAAAYERPHHVVDAAAARFAELGAKVRGLDVLRRTDAEDEANVEVVRAARFVWLAGSSPMHLRSVLKETPVWEALLHTWAEGAVVAASGGAAMAMCEPMVDPRGGAFTVGLGFVAQMAVVAQSDWSPDQAKRTIHLAPAGIPVVGIDGGAALVRDPDGTWRAAGTGDVLVYMNREEQGLDALTSSASPST